MYLLGCISASFGGMFQKDHIQHSTQIIYERCKFGCDRSIINCPFHTPVGDSLQSHPPVESLCTAGAAATSVTVEFGEWVTSRSSKVPPSYCVRNPKGATRDPSLIFGSLERALCFTNAGKSNGVTEGPPKIL
jgi:hypothetical protein